MKVSVVMGTYNHAPLLDRTLASIFAQRVAHEFEVVVVNDGSTDATASILSRYPVVRESIIRQGSGPARARNRAIHLARGEILIMQSDDVMHVSPGLIDRLVGRQRPRLAVFATVHSLDAAGAVDGSYTHPKTRRLPFFFLGSVLREDIAAIGGNDEDFTTAGYEDNWLAECLQHGRGCSFDFSEDAVGHHQFHARHEARYNTWPSKALYEKKLRLAREGRHPWRAASSLLWPQAKTQPA